jgi:ABC-2 type transport system permease protein
MSMIMAVMYREFLIRTTSLTWAFYDLFMPITYLLLFGIGLNTAFTGGVVTGGASLSYQSFFLAGVLAMACFGIAINTSYGFFVDRDNGIFYEFLTYPMTRGEFLIGKITFNVLLSLVQAVITVGLGTMLLGIPLRWDLAWVTLAGVVAGTAGWFFSLSIFALRIRRNDMFNTFINVAYFVLLFASSIFYPLDGLPQWLRTLALLNPLTWLTDVLRFGTVGVGAAGFVFGEAVAFCIFLAITFGIAVRTINTIVVK